MPRGQVLVEAVKPRDLELGLRQDAKRPNVLVEAAKLRDQSRSFMEN